VFYWTLLDFNVVIFKQPGYGLSMRLFPHFPLFLFGHLVTLIHIAMASVTESCYSVVMSLEATPLAVS
jgi:hypothetical protein